MNKELDGKGERWRLNNWGLLKFYILLFMVFEWKMVNIVNFWFFNVCSIIFFVIGIVKSDE